LKRGWRLAAFKSSITRRISSFITSGSELNLMSRVECKGLYCIVIVLQNEKVVMGGSW
jgi:hypothetical protein